ncbi:ATP-binding cassette domain-containing protein [Sinorhizobium meliloti]|uniref:branched-chain amino acid ABC transporter ATP-binding protein/permease n=1 Tax=Rhizobium meliloti TaxID=382 RepID=UPI001294E277|nr:branched-chain amino acid ABC transporter ATP-binding protein/permease [Sinorhizobium meliloti]MQV24882.1 ATP-binding cassette domain-containing protein [Sinorhizobium meliloti]
MRTLAASIAFLTALVAFVPGVPPFWISLFNLIGLASLVAIGLVILTGVGGMTSFGQAAFVGFGAYTSAILTTQYGLSPWATLPIALLVTAVAALLIGLVTIRLSGHYLPLGTIAWGMAIYTLFGNLQITGGFNGISGVPPLTLFGVALVDPKQVYPLVWLSVVVAVVATRNLLNSRVGRAIRALRGGRIAAESFGIHTERYKLAVFLYAALLAGLSGWLFAHIQRAVTPTAFGLNAGIEYLLMAVLGGAGHVYGAILGAAVVVMLKDQLQDVLPIFFGSGGSYEVVVFGLMLYLILQFARDGLWPLIAARFPKTTGRAIEIPSGNVVGAPDGSERVGSEILRANGLVKRFGGLVAVNGVDLSVRAGEIVTLLGPNGAGKSTTFDLLTGISRPSAGEIALSGRRVEGVPSRRIAALGVGRTFQHVKLVGDMTVLENVALGAHLRGRAGFLRSVLKLDRGEEHRLMRMAGQALDLIGLADQAATPVSELSLGSSRLVEIARALCLEPKLLLLDEPAAGLRKFEKDALALVLQRLRRDGLGILLVEHDMDFVMNLTDRILVLDFGTLIAEGVPADIRANAKVQQAYLGGVA